MNLVRELGGCFQILILDNRVRIFCFGFLSLCECVQKPGFGFPGLFSLVLIHGSRLQGSPYLVCISKFGFQGLEQGMGGWGPNLHKPLDTYCAYNMMYRQAYTKKKMVSLVCPRRPKPETGLMQMHAFTISTPNTEKCIL